jgi:Zn-finger nucleic acid-binding protein
MAAHNLRCPGCGAPATADTPACIHCGARLATVGCGSCFGMMFIGSRHCPHCGARAAQGESLEGEALPCPRCACGLHATRVGETEVRDCPQCGGIWLDAEAFRAVTVDRESQASMLAFAPSRPTPTVAPESTVRYAACPRCAGMMNRVNFARISGVIVDTCRTHGTWFDRDELRGIVEFIRGGGIDASRERERVKLEDERRRLQQARQGVSSELSASVAPSTHGTADDTIASVVRFLISWT